MQVRLFRKCFDGGFCPWPTFRCCQAGVNTLIHQCSPPGSTPLTALSVVFSPPPIISAPQLFQTEYYYCNLTWVDYWRGAQGPPDSEALFEWLFHFSGRWEVPRLKKEMQGQHNTDVNCCHFCCCNLFVLGPEIISCWGSSVCFSLLAVEPVVLQPVRVCPHLVCISVTLWKYTSLS